MTTINRAFCVKFRTELERDLAALGKKHGLVITGGNAKFSANELTMQVKCSVIAGNGEVFSREKEDFKRCAVMFGLKPSDLGKKFTNFDGKTFEIVGMMPRSRKFPVLAQTANGKKFKFPAAHVKNRLSAVA